MIITQCRNIDESKQSQDQPPALADSQNQTSQGQPPSQSQEGSLALEPTLFQDQLSTTANNEKGTGGHNPHSLKMYIVSPRGGPTDLIS